MHLAANLSIDRFYLGIRVEAASNPVSFPLRGLDFKSRGAGPGRALLFLISHRSDTLFHFLSQVSIKVPIYTAGSFSQL